MPATFELECSEPSGSIDFDVFEFETLDELAEELRERASSCNDSLVVDLRPNTTPPPFSVPEAMSLLVREFTDAPASLTIRCVLANERARSALVRCLPKAQRPSLVTRLRDIEIEISCGSIVDVNVDAIVNASNSHLHLGGGVSGAIRAATRDPAGLQAAMARLAPIDDSQAVITPSFGLPASRIIHVATASGRREAIAGALRAVFRTCLEHELRSVAIPALGAGTGRLAIDECARLTFDAIDASSGKWPSFVNLILYDLDDFEAFARHTHDKLAPVSR